MEKNILFLTIIGGISSFFIYSTAESKELPTLQQQGQYAQKAHSQKSSKTPNTSQNKSNNFPWNHEVYIPKSRRNRWDEERKSNGKKKSGGLGKNKCRNQNTFEKKQVSADKNKISVKDIKPKVKSERIDDVPLLLSHMILNDLHKIIDNHIPKHWKQRDLSWGWTAIIWLAYILSTGDHRKLPVREFIKGMTDSINKLTGQQVGELDFTDDRLGKLLGYFSKEEIWHKIEAELGSKTIEAYELSKNTVRVDATTVSGNHKVVENGIFQFGNSKDDPSKPQVKIMTGSLDPLSMPLCSDVISGENADDKLYLPIVDRIHSILKKKGVLYVGDCKLSSFNNRLHIRGKIEGHYLCPLPNTGKTPEKLEKWIEDGIEKDSKDELEKYIVTNKRGKEELKAKGYEIEQTQTGEIEQIENGVRTIKKIQWKERILVTNSISHANKQISGFEDRLKKAEEKLYKLTPKRGRGKRQIENESKLIEKANAILKKYGVKDFIEYNYIKEVKQKTKYVGKGRGSEGREKKITEKIRYEITDVIRNKEKIEDKKKKFGWKAYITDVTKDSLSFIDIVKHYRKQYKIEQVFAILKSKLNISPFYVKKKDQVKGITHFLTLGVKIYTLIEFIVRRSLEKKGEKLVGLHQENPKKETSLPTYQRLLHAFSNITLTIIDIGDAVIRHITPLSQVQKKILDHLGLPVKIYEHLGNQESYNILNE